MLDVLEIPLLLFSVVILFIVFYLFKMSAFRYSQIIILFALYSFVVRPISTAWCDSFNPFYMFDKNLYIEGVYISLFYLLFYSAGLILFIKPGKTAEVKIDIDSINKIINILIFIVIFVDLLCLLKFGVVILPGVRTTGLSKAAPGAQVYFSIVSSLIFIATALCLCLLILNRNDFKKNLFKLLLCFLLCIIFYQRGSFVMGFFFGLFLVGFIDKNKLYDDFFKKITIISIVLFSIFFGRAFISSTVSYIFPNDAVYKTHVTNKTSIACNISNKANQEHDQVWPAVLKYTEEYGFDYYNNILAALTRPFFTAEERDELGLKTSVDTLNIYNDRNTYLNYNFGFSISVIQYHYYSIGVFSIILAFIFGCITSILENKMQVREVTIIKLFKVVILYQIVLLFNTSFDERLKWVVINILLMIIVFKLIYPLYIKLIR